MNDQEMAAHVAGLVKTCKSYLDEQAAARETAMEYYAGVMRDFPADEGRSSVVSNDVRAIIKKVLPSITRTILANDKIVEYEPVSQEDEEAAQQATDYVNRIVVPESDAERAIYDAIHDACLVKTGILKWSAYRERKAIIQSYTDQRDDDVLGLMDDPENEILDYEQSEETDPEVLELDPNARRHSFKLKRIEERTRIKLEAVPRGSFLIAPNAESIEAAEIVGEELQPTRSDLVSMGYDRDQVWKLQAFNAPDDGDEEARMGDDFSAETLESRTALEEVLVYEVYAKIDADDDGIAEVHRIVFGDTGSETERHVILGHEQVTEAPYASIVIERDPHQFEGHSVYEDMRDVQRVKTALLRGTLDNIYAQNNQRPVVDLSAVEDPESVTDAEFGKPIILKPGQDASKVIQWAQVPFVAQHSFPMLDYFDQVAKERTGITDASGGLDPESFVNTSATAAELMSEAGIAQADAIVRSVARGGLRKAFRGLLKLVIAHADGPRQVKMSGQWVEYDPRTWNTELDCTINVGLGGGTKERDLGTLQIVKGLQRELIEAFGADNPFVKPQQLYNTLARITETAGFPSAEPYFTEPDPEEIAAKMAEGKDKPDPAMAKLEMQMQLEQQKRETAAQREQSQMEADLHVKQAEIEARSRENAEKLALQREQGAMKHELELKKIEADIIKHRETLAQKAQDAALARQPLPDYFEGGLNG